MPRMAILACLVLVASCAQPSSRPPIRDPDALIIVFADEFHSGILLDRGLVPADLLPAGGLTVPGSRWVVIHFGERRWIRGEADGTIDALRLAVIPGEGGVQIDLVPWWRHDRGGTDPSRVRLWVFPASNAEVAGVITRLHTWIVPGRPSELLAPDACWWVSTRAWTPTNNCHDFTADLLSGAGIELDRAVFILADHMRAALDRAWAERELSAAGFAR